MKYFLFVLAFVFVGCSTDNAVISQSILDKEIDINSAIKNGDLLMRKQVTVSKFDSEVYAHDSKLLIYNGIGYCAYYGNDSKSEEGDKAQSIRISVFDIKNPKERKIFDVFKEDYSYTTLKTDVNQPCYTPVIFVTEENKIRILCRISEKYIQKYCYRDFSPSTETFTDPQVCQLKEPNSENLVDFNISNIRSSVKFLFGEDYNLKTSFMFATSEPVKVNKSYFLGLTVGVFTADYKTDQGTTLLLKTNDQGKTFECIGAPDPRKISSEYNNQFVEGAFDFVNAKEIVMVGRNSLGGLFKSYSFDEGKSFDTPISLNDVCKFNTMAAKPNLIKIQKGGYLSLWNIKENFGNHNVRTVLDINYSADENICNSKLKIRIKNEFGCHYPSLFVYNNEYYLTYTTDSRRFNEKSTGEIVFVKLEL
jgi:hypothetical protein